MKHSRRVKRAPTKSRAGLKRWLYDLNPRHFKEVWWNKAGAKRAGKIAGLGALLIGLVFLYFAKDLPSPGKINARVGAQTTRFYDRKEATEPGKGTVLYEVYGNKNRTVVAFDEMPANIKNATIAVEDKNFYKHGAFSALGIVRAALVDLFSRHRGLQGGSTITQQYVKNALLTPERTVSRKVKELILSFEIEQFYKKDDILKLYLNEIPYGTNAYGIEAACRTYFPYHGTTGCAKSLTLQESSLLAGIPKAPTYYSPYGSHTDDLIARQHLILDLMTEQGYISQSDADGAKIKSDIFTETKISPIQNFYANIQAPHFVLYAQEVLEDRYGVKAVTEGGLKVITTLDLDKQKAAEEAIAKNMATVRKFGGSNAALVSSDSKTGQILAMVGSYNFADKDFGAYNVATSLRQPGSSFKPFAYSTAFKKNYGPGSTLYDVKTDFGGGYNPDNYTDRNYGVQSMRTALAGSLNIPAVKTLYLAGVTDTLKTAKDLGITTLNKPADQYGLSLVLGSGEVKLTEMVNAYESFASGGEHRKQSIVLKVTDPKGKTLDEYKEDKNPKKVLDPQIAFLISSVLSDNGARAFIFGANNPLVVPGQTVAAKTGTTENYRDAWTMGYAPDGIVTGVWAGNNDNKSMTKAASSVSAPIWQSYMIKALAGQPKRSFKQPDGIKQVTLDANTGKLATDKSKVKRTDIFPAWYKPTTEAESKSAQIDKVSGKLATNCTPPLAIETAVSSEIHAEIPAGDPAYARWEAPVRALAASLGYAAGGTLPTDNDNVHSCSDTKPTVNLTASSLGGGNYRLRSVVTSGTFTANKLEVSFDDQIISTQAISGSTTYEFVYAAPSNGSHTFKSVVTDAGLYTGQDTASVNVSGAGGSVFKGTAPAEGSSQSGSVIFNWTDYDGASSYRLSLHKGGSTTTKLSSSSSTIMTPSFGAGTYTWEVEALGVIGSPKTQSLSFTWS